jgi:hypothetical protein
MFHAVRSIAFGAAMALCLWPVAAVAQDEPSTAAMSVEHVLGAFGGAGYVTEQPIAWDWTTPPVTTIRIHDPAQGRVVMALIFRSDADAQIGREQAAQRELLEGRTVDAARPHLVTGYGLSAWRGNVALVETSQTDLNRVFQAQADRDNGVYRDPDVVQAADSVDRTVGSDFLQALDIGAANL